MWVEVASAQPGQHAPARSCPIVLTIDPVSTSRHLDRDTVTQCAAVVCILITALCAVERRIDHNTVTHCAAVVGILIMNQFGMGDVPSSVK